jgi:hypothetical protein
VPITIVSASLINSGRSRPLSSFGAAFDNAPRSLGCKAQAKYPGDPGTIDHFIKPACLETSRMTNLGIVHRLPACAAK